jgi:lipopolysaccharide/colanic/teichoic acid biosynthesis glycosyltransferase
MSRSAMGLINSRFKPNLIVIDKDPAGSSLQSLIITLRESGYDCPIYIFGNNVSRNEKLILLKLGIREIVDTSDQLFSVLKYHEERLEFNDDESRVPYEIVYNIPLWKRSFDVLFSSVVLLFISPILAMIALAVYIESPGPVFYKSKRVGTGYQIFDFLKFRSMYMNADKRLAEMKQLNQYQAEEEVVSNELNENSSTGGSEWLIGDNGEVISESEWLTKKANEAGATFLKIKNDPRITKVGRFIRSTSLDELPQFINVLKGEMSVVGNRPLPLYEAVALTTDQWAARFLAPAGITGLWQVEKRGKGEMSETERKQLDIKYALNTGFKMDLSIILRTIPALMQKENV